ncbi:hypothetical protein [Iningainema tapete]|uniref:Uncharacterized protein n=1 Tax=Iningainema tapete BLCC-T55 TaxID=2748662 RepID=A0A8J7BWC3_9CYAN|nr:hypothetical protein [Iningainema tapete]MBD2770643.1 hypothetical protein [Iningainema tapete BLCC-T55]
MQKVAIFRILQTKFLYYLPLVTPERLFTPRRLTNWRRLICTGGLTFHGERLSGSNEPRLTVRNRCWASRTTAENFELAKIQITVKLYCRQYNFLQINQYKLLTNQ